MNQIGTKVLGRCGFCYQQKMVTVKLVDQCEDCEKEMEEKRKNPEKAREAAQKDWERVKNLHNMGGLV